MIVWNLLMIVIIAFCAQRMYGWRGMLVFLGVLVAGFLALIGIATVVNL